jgi:hypothetical protein
VAIEQNRLQTSCWALLSVKSRVLDEHFRSSSYERRGPMGPIRPIGPIGPMEETISGSKNRKMGEI